MTPEVQKPQPGGPSGTPRVLPDTLGALANTRALTTHSWCWCGQLHDYPLHHHGAIPSERPSAAELREAHKVRAAGGRRSGRSGTDRLRNFKAMNDEKLLDVFMTVLYEDNDPEAQDAVRAAALGRRS